MPQVDIEKPIILNSPYREPTRHFRFDAQNQITGDIDTGRRGSSYFLPIASPKKKTTPGLFDDDIDEQKTESGHVNRIRQLVKQWRDLGWPDITPITRALLDHWHAEDRFRPLFFCQIEALETLIFLTEVAKQTKYGHDWIEKHLREVAKAAGTDLFRVACKMATGSGKTVVMAMLVSWQVLNKRRYPRDNRFTDAFLVVAPGITIRDRLRVILPSDSNNYYKELDIVPVEHRGDLGTARIVITNFHAFKQREKGDAGGLTKRADREASRGVHGIARRNGQPRLQRPWEAPRDHGHQRRGAPLLPGQARSDEGEDDDRGTEGGESTRRGGPVVDHGA
jgi:type III restriction enzyme